MLALLLLVGVSSVTRGSAEDKDDEDVDKGACPCDSVGIDVVVSVQSSCSANGLALD
jgi:hypothetical protein